MSNVIEFVEYQNLDARYARRKAAELQKQMNAEFKEATTVITTRKRGQKLYATVRIVADEVLSKLKVDGNQVNRMVLRQFPGSYSTSACFLGVSMTVTYRIGTEKTLSNKLRAERQTAQEKEALEELIFDVLLEEIDGDIDKLSDAAASITTYVTNNYKLNKRK
jgi:hypothetical protein